MQINSPSAKTYRIVIDGSADYIAIGRITNIQYEYWKNVYDNAEQIEKLDAIICGNRKDYSHTHGGYGYCYNENCKANMNIFNVDCANEFELDCTTNHEHIYVPDQFNFMIDKDKWTELNDIDIFFGACFDNNSSSVMVYDENNSLIFISDMNIAALNQQGIQYTSIKTIDIDVYNDPTVSHYAAIMDEEYGVYFDIYLTLTVPFAPNKLSFGYISFQNEKYVNKVFYNGIEISFDCNHSSGGTLEVYFYEK